MLIKTEKSTENKQLILFDGSCNLCNNSIKFIIKRDHKDVFRFASLQSDLGKKIIKDKGIITNNVDSIILLNPGKAYYVKSDAVIEVLKQLKGIWYLLSYFKWIPLNVRNYFYDFVARNRYKWFGNANSDCLVLTDKLKDKFLEYKKP